MRICPDNFDLDQVLKRCFDVLKQEIRYLLEKSSEGKLSANATRDLVTYIKLLTDLEAKQNELLGKMSSEELKRILQENHESPPTEN